MPRRFSLTAGALILASVTAHTAAADATATIRSLMGVGAVSRSAVHEGGRPVATRGADADTLMRALLGSPAWPRGTARTPRSAPAVDRAWAQIPRCSSRANRAAMLQIAAPRGLTTLRLAQCLDAGGSSAFRLGTALGTPFSLLVAANRVTILDRFGWWQVPLWRTGL